MKYLPTLIVAAAFGLAGCNQQVACNEDALWQQGKAAGVSEARLAVLAALVRELTANGSRYPDPAVLETVIQQRFPVDDPTEDVRLDGYGHRFIYQLSPDGRSWKLYSKGANATDDGGTGDDAPSRGGELSG